MLLRPAVVCRKFRIKPIVYRIFPADKGGRFAPQEHTLHPYLAITTFSMQKAARKDGFVWWVGPGEVLAIVAARLS
ncbi:hypothetical protein MU1_20900 [Paenibacillus glycanilyticus]|uniref:Uncharacterized protein n=1 Tax=Paenibacillus glycanilyticus TaxID=126569 RepID=A0ABQ6GBW4_9BACL|nr:hypothetical protein MU1_20900 [Paenibacillus glycanilyticus]